jgi:hypothetical protein
MEIDWFNPTLLGCPLTNDTLQPRIIGESDQRYETVATLIQATGNSIQNKNDQDVPFK